MADQQVKYTYKDILPLAGTLKVFLILSLVSAIILLISDIMQLELLSRTYTESEAATNDQRQQIVAIAYLVILFITAIIFLKWIYRANVNCRSFNAVGMEYRPGWAIGWYFIPIFAFWKPYQAMKEIWAVSQNPVDWGIIKRRGSPLLRWWWFFWLVTSFLGNIELRLSLNAQTAEALLFATQFAVISDATLIPLNILAFILINRISGFQDKQV